MALTRKRDNFHWSSNKLMSYNKTFNYAVSGRGPGKTTDMMSYIMNLHKRGFMIIILKRMINQISDTTISDFCNAYNILQEDANKVNFTYNKATIKNGICDVFIEGEEMPFFRMIALNKKVTELKGMAFDRPLGLLVFDEYKVGKNEKYLPDEYSKFSELYSTLTRFTELDREGKPKPLRCLFLGNNYSLTDPYLSNMRIPIKDITPGKIITGKNWAFEDIKISDELRAYLLQQNPLFNFGNDAYTKYALDGQAISDQRIKVVEKQPDNFSLRYVFFVENKFLGIYRNEQTGDGKDIYWIGIIDDYSSKRRSIMCFDFESLVDGTCLLTKEDKISFALLKSAFRNRFIGFKSILEGYLFEQIYCNL